MLHLRQQRLKILPIISVCCCLQSRQGLFLQQSSSLESTFLFVQRSSSNSDACPLSPGGEARRDCALQKHCTMHLEACSLLIHLVNGSGRKALCVWMINSSQCIIKQKSLLFFPCLSFFFFFLNQASHPLQATILSHSSDL